MPKRRLRESANLLTHRGNAQAWAVSVHEHRVPVFAKLLNPPVKRLRHRHGRIAQAEIKHVFRPQQAAADQHILRVFAHLADDGFSRQHGFVCLADHVNALPLSPSFQACKRLVNLCKLSALSAGKASAATFCSICSGRLAPMSADVTALLRSVHCRAI